MSERAHKGRADEISGEGNQRSSEATASQFLSIGFHLRRELAGTPSGFLLIGHIQVVHIVEGGTSTAAEESWRLLQSVCLLFYL